ncbi:hypothetical protein FIA58_000325 [Flavobacterium jejuense]|uniref:Uncharacterized protein n=1 Tax=Flavobacterium jejuense TaxID=1544455 RepID=A0ABX0IJV7_9FLAO|nr:hypothetical protein [Flavobacterium jejuense]NHN24107.1 hypothetical protein [Flavobacterium jejuense]
MSNKKNTHTFHIPVMGLAFTIDSPIRVAQYGITSTVSIADDDLIEKMRAFYSEKFSIPYQEITQKFHDYRAERITHYLNLMDTIVKGKFEKFKCELAESKSALENYIALLPNKSELKKRFQVFVNEGILMKDNLVNFIEKNISLGEIDVNIMTKLDKDNFDEKNQLPIEFNDAHASLRGFANSNLNSSVVLSAGMNPRLYSYFENFTDFFPDEEGFLRKKIILKVSDFRSALIQGNFLSKKGLWVSEYRIESGLNCGGHAFATEGYLLGPILQEFKDKRNELLQSTNDLLIKALTLKKMSLPKTILPMKITVQGGVGTAAEHAFLLEEFQLDSIGWGSPFLLVPEATSVDTETRKLLANAKENDFYLSTISPLGVPFNSIKGVSNDYWKQKRINDKKAGSSCPKKFLALNKSYGIQGICTASKRYQDLELEKLDQQKNEISVVEFELKQQRITEKSCLCVGLANASYLENNIPIKGQQQGVVICPGPNLAYFDKEFSLQEMVQHIYGNKNIMLQSDRPNLFIKELKMYVDYLRNEVTSFTNEVTASQIKKWNLYRNNINEGITYYQNLFQNTSFLKNSQDTINQQLNLYKSEINSISF